MRFFTSLRMTRDELSSFGWFGLHPGLGPHWQAPDVDEAGGGTLVEGITLIISSQAIIVKGVV